MKLKERFPDFGQCRCGARGLSLPVATLDLCPAKTAVSLGILCLTFFLPLSSISQAQVPVESAQRSQVSYPEEFAHSPGKSSVCCLSECEPLPERPTNVLAKIGEALWRPIQQIGIDYTRNRIWPEPYATMDRATIPPVYFQMIANGWQQQTLLGDPHFVVSQDRLSEAGKAKVRWIAQAVPSARRVIFVHSPDPTIGAKREEAVRRYLESLKLDGPPPPIILTTVEPRWASGAELGLIHQKFQESSPNPRLPTYQPYQVQSP